jgi:hypothetical protein
MQQHVKEIPQLKPSNNEQSVNIKTSSQILYLNVNFPTVLRNVPEDNPSAGGSTWSSSYNRETAFLTVKKTFVFLCNT